jgi:hypothetical protein
MNTVIIWVPDQRDGSTRWSWYWNRHNLVPEDEAGTGRGGELVPNEAYWKLVPDEAGTRRGAELVPDEAQSWYQMRAGTDGR